MAGQIPGLNLPTDDNTSLSLSLHPRTWEDFEALVEWAEGLDLQVEDTREVNHTEGTDQSVIWYRRQADNYSVSISIFTPGRGGTEGLERAKRIVERLQVEDLPTVEIEGEG